MFLSRKKVVALIDSTLTSKLTGLWPKLEEQIANFEKRMLDRFNKQNDSFAEIRQGVESACASRIYQLELEIKGMKDRQIAREIEATQKKLKKPKLVARKKKANGRDLRV